MSYTVAFYLCKIDELQKSISSNNTAILDELDIGDAEREYAETLLIGVELDPESGSEYGYALEKIVKHLFGKNESISEFEDLHFGEFDDPPLDWILQSGPPVILPPYDDYPYIGHRYLADIQKTLDEWDDDSLDDFEPEIQEMIEGVLNVYQTAIERKKDLVTFYY